MTKKNQIVLIIVISVLALDQATKAALVSYLSPYQSVTVIPGIFNIVSVRNPGAAFGILQGGGSIILTVVSFVALIVIGVLLYQAVNKKMILTLSFIAGGALGNMVDRLRMGEVIDFLDFHIGRYHWPAFNVADSAITVGVISYLVVSYLCKDETNREEG